MNTQLKRILVVDDDPLVLSVLDHALTYAGYDVIKACDGIDALERINDSGASPDLALIDFVMPRMNGRDLAQILLSSNPGIKIMFMSGYHQEAADGERVSERAIPFLEKPFGLNDLLEKIGGENPSFRPDPSRS